MNPHSSAKSRGGWRNCAARRSRALPARPRPTPRAVLANVFCVKPYRGLEFDTPHCEEDMQIVSTERAPRAIGPYSQAIVTESLIFTAGQVAFDPATTELVPGG